MSNPFSDPQTQRTRFAPSPNPSSSYLQAQTSYPPAPYPTLDYDDGNDDVGFERQPGVQVNGLHIPWLAGEDDDELKPLNAGFVTDLSDFSAFERSSKLRRPSNLQRSLFRPTSSPFLGSDPYATPRLLTAPSARVDFIRRQTIPKRGATTRRVKLTSEGNWINELVQYPIAIFKPR